MVRSTAVLNLVAASAFRPPAIPLITTDPYLQSFIMGDSSTDGIVKHWEQRSKEMVGLVRVDGEVYRFLGDCGRDATPVVPGPMDTHDNVDISPDACDLTSYQNVDSDSCNELCYGLEDCKAFVIHESDEGTRCWLKSCDSPMVSRDGSTGYVITGEHPPLPPSTCDFPVLEQQSLEVQATRTFFQLRDPKGRVELNVTFLSTLFTDDYARLSRPVSYVVHDVRSLSDQAHSVELYLDATAQWVVDSRREEVTWRSEKELARIGTAAQNILGHTGDKTNINWGYLYLRAADQAQAFAWAGSANSSRDAFAAHGSLAKLPSDDRQPRRSDDSLPAVAVSGALQATTAPLRHTVLVAYDDVQSVRYYNEGNFSGFWTRTWPDIENAMDAAAEELDEMLEKSFQHDGTLASRANAAGGSEYAQLIALAYRQTLAATKLVWNNHRNEAWNFLKEISTNGDMQTMDVIYPASPMLLATQPDLLARLLVPVLAFANNETSTPFTDPYSPHEIGTYPVADHNTEQQEDMPMENTGNMFLMLAGVVRAGEPVDFFYPKYWQLLSSWATFLESSLPFPADQLCTDDFTGRLANNTNLAAKGIVALEAFALLCDAVGEPCDGYRQSARGFAKTWKTEAWEDDHFKIAYDFPNSYSIKYNLLWQKLLDLDGPFDWDSVVPTELKYYLSKSNTYGVPMDSRHTYTKLDWLSWAAAMADNDETFHAFHDPIYKLAQESPSRVPLTDLYDTKTGKADAGPTGFVDRPVVGGIFAKLLRAEQEARKETVLV